MTIYEIYKSIEYLLNKDQFGRAISVARFNQVIPLVEIDLFKQRYGLPQHYQPGMPVPQMSYEITQKISDDTSAFKVWMGSPQGGPLMAINSAGIATKPPGYVHVSAIRSVDERPVEVLFNGEFNERLTNPNRTPTHKHPVCTFYGDYIEFRPKNLVKVHFIYLRLPVYANLVVTNDPVTDSIVYDPVNSVQTMFPEDMHTEYVRRAMSYISLNLRSEFGIQISNSPEK
jgi:hypothetical protein